MARDPIASLPQILLSSIQEQRAVLFLGAGASAEARDDVGRHPPTSNQLRAELAKKFLGKPFEGYDLMSVAEMAISSHGAGRVLEYIKDLLTPFSPSPAHVIIPRFRWRGIATTNYDVLVEAAYDAVPDRLQTLVRFVKDTEPVYERMDQVPHPVQFIKLHGCLDHIHDAQIPPILTPEHYEQYAQHRRRLFDRLNDWAHEFPVIFCGYRLGDAHIRRLIDTLGRGARPTFYLVVRQAEQAEVSFWAQRNVQVIPLSFTRFMSALENAIPPLIRTPIIRAETVGRPVRRHFRTNAEESDRLRRALEHNLTLIRADLPHSEQDPKQFYHGFDVGWGCIRQKLDVQRRIVNDLLFETVLDETNMEAPRFVVLKGAGGAGKTIALKRAAWDAATALDALVLWKEPGGGIDISALGELIDLTGKRVYLFVDRIALEVENIVETVRAARQRRWAITIIGAERTSEWNVYCDTLEQFKPREMGVGRLSRGEIEQLIDLLVKYQSLGALAEMSRESQVRFFHSQADRQLLVALHQATSGKPFEEIVYEEYEAVVPDRARQLYLDICTFNQFAVPVRAGTISRISGIGFRDYEREFMRPLEGLVNTHQDAISGDYHYRARHSHVAGIVFRQACPSDDQKADQLVRILQGIDIGYSTDLKVLSRLVRGRNLLESFGRSEGGREVYRAACAIAPDSAFVLQQWAIFESTHDGGSLGSAEELANEARALEPRNKSVIHTQAEVARKRATEAPSPVLKEQLRRQARERLNEIHPSADPFATATRCKLLVDEVQELAQEIGDQTRMQDITHFSDKVVRAEQALARAMQQHPDDAEFLQIEARFREAIEQKGRALLALEKAWAAGPRGSGVAIRLARAYAAGGDRAKAQQFLEGALDRNPTDKSVHLEMAKQLLLGSEDETLRAGEHFAKSYVHGDQNHDARHLHAQYLFLIGEVKRSFDLFEIVDSSAPKEFRTRARMTTISEKLPRLTGRVVKKTSPYAFIRSSTYPKDIFAPEALSAEDIWEEIQANNEVNFSVGFNRAGPIAVALQLGRG